MPFIFYLFKYCHLQAALKQMFFSLKVVLHISFKYCDTLLRLYRPTLRYGTDKHERGPVKLSFHATVEGFVRKTTEMKDRCADNSISHYTHM